MTEADPTESMEAATEVARLRRRVEVGARYEEDTRAGVAGPIEDYLRSIPAEERAALLDDLKSIAAWHAQRAEGAATVTQPVPMAVVEPGPSSMLGPYRIEEEIGRGGMANVYRARDTREIDRVVALKVLHARSEEMVQRFGREKRVNGRLDDIGIVPIYDVGEDHGRQYLVMKYFPGGSLAHRVAPDGRLPDREAAALVAKVARAVHHSHLRGVIHRDLKPSNILLDEDGQPRVSDFGLARLLESDDEITRSGSFLGTVAYTAPEQAADPAGAGRAADVYSLGATLYRLVTGRPPFLGADLRSTLRQVMQEDPRPPRLLNPGVSLDLDAICLKCLEKDPRRRYAGAQELADELERVVRGEPTRTRPLGWIGRLDRWARRRPQVAALVGSLVALAVASLVAVTLLYLRAERSLRALERDEYFHLLALAAEALTAGRSAQAEGMLASCPEGLVDWEWRLLRRWASVPPAVLSGPDDRPSSAAFLGDSSSVACVGRAGYARIWDTASGRAEKMPGMPPGVEFRDVAWLASSGAGGTIVVASSDGTLRMWDRADGSWTARPSPWPAPGISYLAAHGPSGRLLAGCDDGRLILWDLASGRSEVLALVGRIRDVAVSPDGRSYAATGEDLRVWFGRFGEGPPKELDRLDGSGLALAFGPDDRTLAVGTATGSVYLRDTSGPGPARLLGRHHDSVNSLAFGPGGRLASGGDDGRVRIWDVADGRETLSLEVGGVVTAVAFSPDHRSLLAACDDGPAIVWSTAAPPPPRDLPRTILTGPRATVVALAISAGGVHVASGDNSGTVLLWDLPQLVKHELVDPDGGPPQKVNAVAFRGDGLRLAAGGRDGVVRIWDVTTRALLRRLKPDAATSIFGLAYSPDGRSLASIGFGGAVVLWDADAPVAPRILGHQPDCYAVAFHPGGKLIATGGGDYMVRLWDATRGGPHALPLVGHDATIEDLAFSPDGRYLASGDDRRVAILWDLGLHAPRRRLLGHASRIWNVAFSPDSRLLATAGGDGLRLWDVENGMTRVQLAREGLNRLCAVAFSPDGRFLASGGDDRAVTLWDASVWAGPGAAPPASR